MPKFFPNRRLFVVVTLIAATAAVVPAASAKDIPCTRKVDWTTLIKPGDVVGPPDAAIVIRAQTSSVQWMAEDVNGKLDAAVRTEMSTVKEVPLEFAAGGKENVVGINFRYVPHIEETDYSALEFGETFYITGRWNGTPAGAYEVKIKRPMPKADWPDGTTCTAVIDKKNRQIRYDFVLP